VVVVEQVVQLVQEVQVEMVVVEQVPKELLVEHQEQPVQVVVEVVEQDLVVELVEQVVQESL
tara:strand:+ start:328 stop:513 length:186 start_codon:yes stop_codon:yes gene_type:complete